MSGEWAEANGAALEVLHTALARLTQRGPAGASLRVLNAGNGSDPEITMTPYTLSASNAWISNLSADFTGMVAFTCLVATTKDGKLYAQALDGSNGVRIQHTVAVRKQFAGGWRMVGSSSEVEIVDRGRT